MDRVNLTLPTELNDQVIALSREHGIPVVQLIRRFIELGLLEDQKGPFSFKDDAGQEVIVEIFPPQQEDNKHRIW